MPLGLKRWFAERGIANAIELDWWQSHRVGGVGHRRCVPAQHWSARGLRDRMKTLWGGFAVLAPDCHLFFAGDTGYSRDFADIREHFADRQTSQPAAASTSRCCRSAPTSRAGSCGPARQRRGGLKIHRDLGAKRSLGVHWGTFELTDEALDEPPRELAAIRERDGIDEEEFFVLPIGGTKLLPVRNARQPAGIAATRP